MYIIPEIFLLPAKFEYSQNVSSTVRIFFIVKL